MPKMLPRLAGSVAFALALCLGTLCSFAQDGAGPPPLPDAPSSIDEEKAIAALQAFWQSLHPQTGEIVLGDDLVTLAVPEGFYFLDRTDAERVLVDLWGNPPGDDALLGMLFPAEYKPFDDGNWAVVVDYTDDGHVSDAEAASIDYEEMLAAMKRDVEDTNPARVKQGYEPIELVGWAEPPHYDSASRKLYWAKELRFGDSPEETLNYEIRALGRTGVLSMTFVAAADKLAEINESREQVLAMANFNTGHRYEEFDSNIDKVAAYGIGALIAGKVAAKAGLLAGGLLLLKKFGVLAVIAFGALARKLKSMFSRSA
jgi:uncharacterized membrane-anchored protein